MDLNRALSKLVSKYLPDSYQQDETLNPFLEGVSRLLATYEKDKKMSEHAYEISEKEFQILLNDLKYKDKIQNDAIEQISELIHSMDKSLQKESNKGKNLSSVISFLQDKVNQAKDLEVLLVAAKEQAEQNSRAKTNFLSVMSHEIRTPLNAIIGSIHLLRQEEMLPAQNEYFSALQVSADNLLTLINDVLDYNKIEEGKIELAQNQVNIHQLLKNIKLSNQFRAAEYKNLILINYDSEIPKTIITDETRMAQILNNLVSNAIKFTENGTVEIQAKLVNNNGQHCEVLFNIKDSGIGIEESKIGQIFERFTQADSNINRKYGGSGLGLTIVKKLLLIQNSEIKVTSEIGKGSVFSFQMVFRISDQEFNNEIIQHKIKDLQKAKILLVEDNRINVVIAKKMLSNWNSIVEVAEDGQIALGVLSQNQDFDIILMDLHMPVLDGISTTEILRKQGLKTPIVALTASALFEVQENVKNAGMNGYVSKPFNPDELYSVIYKNIFSK